MEELYGEWEKRISPLRSLPLRSLLLRSFFSMVRGLFGFKPHASLLRHEGYKILIVSRAMLILLVFGFLAGYSEWRQSYSLSAQETYYQSLMLQLEGGLTEEKEQLLLAEQRRYQEAFDRVSQIDRMVSEGEMTENAGENLKAKWYAVTYFYPSFVRAWEQYEQIRAWGGELICSLPVWGFLLLLALSQAAVLAGAALVVFGLSCRGREFLGTCFLAAVVLLLPLALLLLGFSFAEHFSLYPLYSWAAP